MTATRVPAAKPRTDSGDGGTDRADPAAGAANAVIDSADGVHVECGGRILVSFAGCDLLGLARHPDVVAAAHRALDAYGASASASRTTTGTLAIHRVLERTLAVFFGAKDAVALPAGWLAAQALVRTVAKNADAVLLDDAAHPAVADAAALSGLPVRRYAHFDAAAARRAAKGAGRVLLLTDGVDVARGAVAPLARLAAVAKEARGHLVVDDSHGAGLIGRGGLGSVAHAGAAAPHVHTVGSLSKAFGSQGGFVTGTRRLCDAVRRAAAAYSGATPLAPAAAAAATHAVFLASAENDDPARLAARRALVSRMRKHFRRLGLATPAPGLPWFAVTGRPEATLARASQRLAEAGFLVPHLHYFGGPPEGMLKIAVSATHTAEQIDALGAALATALVVGGRRGARRVTARA